MSDPAKAKSQSWRGQSRGEPEKQPVRYSTQFEPSELVYRRLSALLWKA